ncbi:MAG: CRISPR-associated endonuclease Cas2 [Candidatus Nealsonbacteria bacterium]|nr:CRISPR-associated endonuclease Cas2 [Candidatus Nealsonbacteria bacterium]
MKSPLTDKFLWGIYNFYKATDKALTPPDIFRFKTIKEIMRPKDPDFWRKLEDKRSKQQFAQFVNYLKRKGYIKIENLKGKSGILLTPRGREKALRCRIFARDNQFIQKRKDGKWIMVIFDVPENKRRYRDELRKILYALGFQRLQKSVWVCPNDVLERLEEAIRIYNIDYYVRTFLIEEIDI